MVLLAAFSEIYTEKQEGKAHFKRFPFSQKGRACKVSDFKSKVAEKMKKKPSILHQDYGKDVLRTHWDPTKLCPSQAKVKDFA